MKGRWTKRPREQRTLEERSMIQVDDSKCDGCGSCAELCPVGAITVDLVARIDAESCIDCEACVDECPSGALSFVEEEIAPSNPDAQERPATQSTESWQTNLQLENEGPIAGPIFHSFEKYGSRGGRGDKRHRKDNRRGGRGGRGKGQW
jgi:ferredoxin